jgi:general secretion pathway protein M
MINFRTLSAEQSRKVALALLAGVIVLAVAAVAVPTWLAHRHYDRALTDGTDLLQRYRRIAATRPDITRSLETMRAREARKFFLRPGAPALSAAEGQEVLRQLIEGNGARLITMQVPPSKEEGRYRQITVNVQLTANIQALRRILHTIESATPYLFVDNLMIRSSLASNYRPSPGAEPEMFVQFDVYGYSQTGS